MRGTGNDPRLYSVQNAALAGAGVYWVPLIILCEEQRHLREVNNVGNTWENGRFLGDTGPRNGCLQVVRVRRTTDMRFAMPLWFLSRLSNGPRQL